MIFVMRLLLGRHGQSIGDVEPRRIEGSADFPLTDVGRKQAKMLALAIASQYTVDRIFSSPLVRAHETATTVAGATGLTVQIDPRLAERNSGLLAGMTHEQADRLYPVSHPVPVYHRPPEGESYLDQFRRVAECYFETISNPQWAEQTVVVVAHGGTLNCMLDAALGLPPLATVDFACADGCLHELAISPGGHVRVVRLNATAHVEGIA